MKEADPAAAFERCVLPHLDAAHNFARSMVRDPWAAEDVAQEAVTRAWKYFASFRGERDKAWLLQIVRNVAYDHFGRSRTRSAEGPLSSAAGEGSGREPADPRPGPEQTAMQEERMVGLARAVEMLPAALRECLILREVEGLSYKEIGRVVGVPTGTVMSRLCRARQALRDDAHDEAEVPRYRAGSRLASR